MQGRVQVWAPHQAMQWWGSVFVLTELHLYVVSTDVGVRLEQSWEFREEEQIRSIPGSAEPVLL